MKEEIKLKIFGKSMFPSIREGDELTIEVYKDECFSLELGDIITFYDEEALTTHRVIKVGENDVVTKGDFSLYSEIVKKSDVVGKVISCNERESFNHLKKMKASFCIKSSQGKAIRYLCLVFLYLLR